MLFIFKKEGYIGPDTRYPPKFLLAVIQAKNLEQAETIAEGKGQFFSAPLELLRQLGDKEVNKCVSSAASYCEVCTFSGNGIPYKLMNACLYVTDIGLTDASKVLNAIKDAVFFD